MGHPRCARGLGPQEDPRKPYGIETLLFFRRAVGGTQAVQNPLHVCEGQAGSQHPQVVNPGGEGEASNADELPRRVHTDPRTSEKTSN